MKVVVIGTGTIGAAVADALSSNHEVVRVSRHGPIKGDMEDRSSLEGLFASVKDVDAVAVCAGVAAFKPLAQLTDEDFALGLRSKLMGQVKVVQVASRHLKDGGSITLSGGILAHLPQPGGAAYSLVNAALEGFVVGAAIEMPRGIRLNLVSPPWMSETLKSMGQDPANGIPAAKCARAYVSLIEGRQNGEIVDARKFA
ncbi:MAG TPA: short chain dehydrogenase [Anaeromyxobacteraceae bacterium]|nr:short chain dehydrogenase [Anaeromyxobacteraceae bacterium]